MANAENDKRSKETSFVSDFDIMLARRKAQNGKRRQNTDGGMFINNSDDMVSDMITKMTEAAELDRHLNANMQMAITKLTLLPTVVMQLKKLSLKETFIDLGGMAAISEWLSPLPDKSLPALRVREELLKILQEMPCMSHETLKHSGIGKAIMVLYKHPKESRPNKQLALKLINKWSRPIFGLTLKHTGMTTEERRTKDLNQQTLQRKRLSSAGETSHRDSELTGGEKRLRPGDPGFSARAQVPEQSLKDYIVRPQWNAETESIRGSVLKAGRRVSNR